MKSSFGRSFFAIATVLLLSLVLLGTSFQMLINDYMTDNTIEGLCSADGTAFSVQYHPESAPGPQDSTHLFTEFTERMKAFRGRQ